MARARAQTGMMRGADACCWIGACILLVYPPWAKAKAFPAQAGSNGEGETAERRESFQPLILRLPERSSTALPYTLWPICMATPQNGAGKLAAKGHHRACNLPPPLLPLSMPCAALPCSGWALDSPGEGGIGRTPKCKQALPA